MNTFHSKLFWSDANTTRKTRSSNLVQTSQIKFGFTMILCQKECEGIYCLCLVLMTNIAVHICELQTVLHSCVTVACVSRTAICIQIIKPWNCTMFCYPLFQYLSSKSEIPAIFKRIKQHSTGENMLYRISLTVQYKFAVANCYFPVMADWRAWHIKRKLLAPTDLLILHTTLSNKIMFNRRTGAHVPKAERSVAERTPRILSAERSKQKQIPQQYVKQSIFMNSYRNYCTRAFYYAL